MEKGAQLIRPGQRLDAPFKRRPSVEIPTDQHDSVPGAQHSRLYVHEVIGRVDDTGELVGTRHTPARLAGSQQSIVAHADSITSRLRCVRQWPGTLEAVAA